MPALRVMGFDGEYPRTEPTLLTPTQAQVAQNVKLYSGTMKMWNGQLLTYSTVSGPSNIQTIYRLYGSASSLWMVWAAVVDAVPGPIADVSDFRLYYTGDPAGIGGPKKTNWALANGAAPYPSAYYEMGCPAPTAALVATPSSSASPINFYTYVYTYVNQFGSVTEESAPSPACAIANVDSGASVTLSGFTAPPTGHYNWQGRNIYRSVAGASTSTYEFVTYLPLATTSYVDSLTVAQLGGVLPTLGWLPPPTGLLGLVSMGQGSLAGFVGNTLYMSVPYYPHAWPVANEISLPYEIVGLSVMSGNIVVMTTNYPYVVSGLTPSQMSVQQLPLAEPCLSKAGIISNALGVLYPSPNGLVSIGAGGAAIISTGLFRRQEWQALNPGSMKGIAYDGKYFGVFTGTSSANPAMVLDPTDVPALSFLTMNARAAFVDIVTGEFFIVSTADNNIYQVDANTLTPLQMTWTSKRFMNPQAIAMSAIKVDADYTLITANAAYLAMEAAVTAANTAAFAGNCLGTLNSERIDILQVNGSLQSNLLIPASALNLQVFIYGDNTLICGLSFTSLDPVRLPPFKAREIYFTVVGSITVRSVEMATSVRDLDPKAWSESTGIPALFT